MSKSFSLIIIIVVSAPNFLLAYGISFVTRPENATFLRGQISFFNCSTDVFSDSGIDWVFTPFSSPDSELRVVQWYHGNSSTVQPGFTVERPNNLTSNLIISNPNSSLAGRYCCQYKNEHGEKSCAYAKEINLPQNEVVVAGRGVMLNCAQVKAFRWYRYLPTDLLDDKVIYMGSKMADDVDERFKVYTEPDHYPYDRLDLYMSNVQNNLFGTYKCQQPRRAHCAEIIVLASEPACDVHLVKKFGMIAATASLTCGVRMTENAEPEMFCGQNSTGFQMQANCSERRDGVVTCAAEVDLKKLPNMACEIKFNPKPLQKYTTCSHVSNQPSYSYKWSPSSDELLQLNSTQLTLIASLAASVVIILIQTLVIVLSIRRKSFKRFIKRTDSSDTSSTKSESLSIDSEEKSKILDDMIRRPCQVSCQVSPENDDYTIN